MTQARRITALALLAVAAALAMMAVFLPWADAGGGTTYGLWATESGGESVAWSDVLCDDGCRPVVMAQLAGWGVLAGLVALIGAAALVALGLGQERTARPAASIGVLGGVLLLGSVLVFLLGPATPDVGTWSGGLFLGIGAGLLGLAGGVVAFLVPVPQREAAADDAYGEARWEEPADGWPTAEDDAGTEASDDVAATPAAPPAPIKPETFTSFGRPESPTEPEGLTPEDRARLARPLPKYLACPQCSTTVAFHAGEKPVCTKCGFGA